MAVCIRLKRVGGKKRPYYRIVAADSRFATDGRILEQLGTYDPLPEPEEVKIEEDRARYWLSVGAQPSDTVSNIFDRQGIK